MTEDMTPKEDRLNTRAYLALSGGQLDIQGAIVALLRSSAPIHAEVRSALADAIEKTDAEPGIRLELRGNGSGKKENVIAHATVRSNWIAAARHMQDLIDAGSTIDDAKRHVGSFGIGASQAATAWKYYTQARRWAAERVALREMFEDLFAGDHEQVQDALFALYHGYMFRLDHPDRAAASD